MGWNREGRVHGQCGMDVAHVRRRGIAEALDESITEDCSGQLFQDTKQ
jgi:hypothetical protein